MIPAQRRMSFVAAFWASARRAPVAKRCALIALSVGTILSVANQWEAMASGDVRRIPWARILANYVVPFVVSNLGAMASLATEKDNDV